MNRQRDVHNYYVVTYALPLILFHAIVAAVTGLGVDLDCVRPLVLTGVAARAIISVAIGPLVCYNMRDSSPYPTRVSIPPSRCGHCRTPQDCLSTLLLQASLCVCVATLPVQWTCVSVWYFL
jgi:hypothetical protein